VRYDDYVREMEDRHLMIIWKCDKCGMEREEPPGYNEGGFCDCGGTFYKAGESYDAY